MVRLESAERELLLHNPVLWKLEISVKQELRDLVAEHFLFLLSRETRYEHMLEIVPN